MGFKARERIKRHKTFNSTMTENEALKKSGEQTKPLKFTIGTFGSKKDFESFDKSMLPKGVKTWKPK
jgi:hypothetical protein